jgi:hypothetical protein
MNFHMLRKSYKLLWFAMISTLLWSASSCYYPYTTAKARKDRRQKRQEIRLQKRLMAKAKQDSIAQALLAQGSKNEPKPPIQSPDTSSSQQNRPNLNNPTDPKKRNTELPDSSQLAESADSLKLNLADTNLVRLDSLANDSIPPADSLAKIEPEKTEPVIELNPDSLAGPLQYNGEDSMIYSIREKKIKLYGNAEVIYENYELKAGYIEIDFSTFVATAEGLPDSSGQMRQEPFFNDGNQQFDARKIQYNFKTKKGKVYDAITKQGDGYFLSKATKFVSKDADSTAKDDIIYAGGCTYTTCDHKQPHFGIRSSKAKVIPNKLIVVGPSYLEIMGTPTPVVLPFGFFPITQKRKSGLILSTNVDNSPTLGIGIRGMGYYLAINDNVDLSLTGDIYSRGTFRLYAASNYYKRYKATGNINLSYARTKIDERGTPDFDLRQDFNLSWTHSQDAKAHPSQTFRASVNFGTSDFYRNTDPTANATLQATMQSNVSFTKRFLGTPFSFAMGMTHSQNTSSNTMNITLPRSTLTMNQIFPFKRKKQVGKQQWYEKIGVSYNMTANNRIQIVDTMLFEPDAWQTALEEAQYSVVHAPNVNMNFKLPRIRTKKGKVIDLSYINFQPTISYREYWYFYSNEREFDPTLIIQTDTTFDDEGIVENITSDTTFGTVNQIRDYGFNAVRDFSAGVNLGTQFFATGTFNILGLHKLRAIIRPNVGFSWRPDYSTDFWGYYGQVQTDARYPNEFDEYRRFDVTPSSGQQALLNFNANMRMEGKLKRFRPDTTAKSPYRKVAVIENLSISGNYNMAADSLKMSTLAVGMNTKLFKIITTRVSFVFDPYAANTETNNRIDVWEWDQNRRLVRLTSGTVALSTNLNNNTLKDLFQPNAKKASNKQQKQNAEFQFFQALSLNYNYRFSKRYIDGVDSLQVTANELSMSGGLNLSKNWNIRINRIGYDFDEQRITYPDFTFARRLHCWEMGLSWQPERRTWRFFIQVRPGSLGFIKIPMQKVQFDPY